MPGPAHSAGIAFDSYCLSLGLRAISEFLIFKCRLCCESVSPLRNVESCPPSNTISTMQGFQRPLLIPNENLLFMIHGLNSYKCLYVHAQNMWIHRTSESIHVKYVSAREKVCVGGKEGAEIVFVLKKLEGQATTIHIHH